MMKNFKQIEDIVFMDDTASNIDGELSTFLDDALSRCLARGYSGTLIIQPMTHQEFPGSSTDVGVVRMRGRPLDGYGLQFEDGTDTGVLWTDLDARRHTMILQSNSPHADQLHTASGHIDHVQWTTRTHAVVLRRVFDKFISGNPKDPASFQISIKHVLARSFIKFAMEICFCNLQSVAEEVAMHTAKHAILKQGNVVPGSDIFNAMQVPEGDIDDAD